MTSARATNTAECSCICCSVCLRPSVLQTSPASRVPIHVSATPEKRQNMHTRCHTNRHMLPPKTHKRLIFTHTGIKKHTLPRKTKTDATRCQIFRLKCIKFDFHLGQERHTYTELSQIDVCWSGVLPGLIRWPRANQHRH